MENRLRRAGGGSRRILREYHERVAGRLADRADAPGGEAARGGPDVGFSPEAYVEAELATDAS